MLLQAKHIDFSYGDEAIFDDFNLAVEHGERVVLKGESGGGKSTLMRLLLGFEVPGSGTLEYDGTPLNGKHLRQFRRECAWLPQDLNIGTGRVDEVILFPFRFKQSGNSMPDEEKILDILSDLGLDADILQKEFTDLSTGQRQRVGIALCILLDKPVLLLDEPTSALDEASKEKAAGHLFSDPDRTVLSTSHDPFWLERCDRIIDLDAESEHKQNGS